MKAMELNREQIVKALECCASNSLTDCNRCPIDEQKKDNCECGRYLAIQALALIRELTEENERLRAEVSVKKKLLDKCEERFSSIKADTVRKMLQRIKEDALSVSLLSNPPKFMLEISEDALDQIAKELGGLRE